MIRFHHIHLLVRTLGGGVLPLNCSDHSGVVFLINVMQGAKCRLSYAFPSSLANNMETKVDTV